MYHSMSQQEFEEKYNVRFVNKKDSIIMRAIGAFLSFTAISPGFVEDFFTTYRLPFQKKGTIACPSTVEHPMQHWDTLEHELVHVEQQSTAWGLFKAFWLVWLVPLPFVFSGRWFIERDAYLADIKKGRMTVTYAVNTLWTAYGWAWPKPLMKKWFKERL